MQSVFRKVNSIVKKDLAQIKQTATIIKLNDFMFLISFTPMLNLKTNIEIYVNDFIQNFQHMEKCGLVSQRTILTEFGYGFFHRMKKGNQTIK